jgi:hypothetical protein
MQSGNESKINKDLKRMERNLSERSFCSFSPRLSPRTQELAARFKVPGLPHHETLYNDAYSRAMRRSNLQHSASEKYTFKPATNARRRQPQNTSFRSRMAESIESRERSLVAQCQAATVNSSVDG